MNAAERLIRWVMRDTAFHKMYACTVQAQSSDGATLDLIPDEAAIGGQGGLQAVQLRHGLPGVVVKVPVGARVMLGFENGDPGKPFAALWEPGQIESLSFGGGTKPIARIGDAVDVYWPATITFLPGSTIGGAALVGKAVITSKSIGIIVSGNPKVTA
jgi:hypothetical protein